MPETADIVERALRAKIAAAAKSPFVMGICGAQGSGKSTLADTLQKRLVASGYKVALLSLDDLYFSKDERQRLAATVHPLFRTRGVPGTHDVALGEAVLDDLAREGVTRLPRFDKRRDMRLPHDAWDAVDGPADIILFEGWCVGARPQADDELAAPVNSLERDEDPDGAWRRAVNGALRGDYRRLFDRLHMLVLLAAPSFDVVAGWRIEQEATLRHNLEARGESTDGLMSDVDIARFVLFYERLTRHILEEMPGRADLVIRLDAARRPVATN
ncbi:MAG: kinase [Rhodospirillaceae bacterium]|nr:MAG: kinase [Rhodospirillaceae bacterium]